MVNLSYKTNKTNLSKECDICHYWYFKDIGFKYEPYLCNGCNDLMQKAMSYNNIAKIIIDMHLCGAFSSGIFLDPFLL